MVFRNSCRTSQKEDLDDELAKVGWVFSKKNENIHHQMFFFAKYLIIQNIQNIQFQA